MDILVADDEEDIRTEICAILEDEGYQVRSCATIAEAQAAVETRLPSMAILDVWFQHCHQDGLSLLAHLQKLHSGLPVIMISGHATVDMAVRALREGACDFLTKPFTLNGLLHAVDRGLREAKLIRENEDMAKLLGRDDQLPETLSTPMMTVLKNTEQWAKTDRRVLITGEVGVGKSYLAQHLHQLSARAHAGFQRHNCADFVHDDEQASVLFGEGGEQVGKIELAHRGTLLLENIESLQQEMQQKISHFLRTKQFQRLRQQNYVEVDVRVLSTSALPIHQLQGRADFSQLLLDQLNLGVLDVPALRQRIEDLPALVRSIQQRLGLRLEQSAPIISPQAMEALARHPWPNNVRELENVLTRLHHVEAEISEDHVRRAIGDEEHHQQKNDLLRWQKLISGLDGKLRDAREEFEQHFLRYHLDRFHGNISKTAQYVGLDRASLHRKIRALGIDSAAGEEGME